MPPLSLLIRYMRHCRNSGKFQYLPPGIYLFTSSVNVEQCLSNCTRFTEKLGKAYTGAPPQGFLFSDKNSVGPNFFVSNTFLDGAEIVCGLHFDLDADTKLLFLGVGGQSQLLTSDRKHY